MRISKAIKNILGLGLVSGALMTSSTLVADPFGGRNGGLNFDGGVYVMSNKLDGNTVVAYGRKSDGSLKHLGEFETGGIGSTDFDGGEGLDPLISAYAILMSDDRRHLFVVNAGDNTVTSFRIKNNLELAFADIEYLNGVGPNSLAYRDGELYVSTIDADGIFAGEPDQEGALEGFRVAPNGKLRPIRNSFRELENRPSAIQFSPDGRFLVVSSINAGSSALESDNQDAVSVYGVQRNGRLTAKAIDGATSTLRDNEEGRNLPSAIGFEIVEDEGRQYVVVTEAREFQPNGAPPVFPNLQTGSVSTWELTEHGRLKAIDLDVLAGNDFTDGERTACWIEFSKDGNEFWVSNALDSSISTYTFDQGKIELKELIAAQGVDVTSADPATAFSQTDGFIDLWASDNGEYLYQLLGLSGGVNVYKTDDDGQLTLIQEVTGDLPEQDTQGIVAF